MQKVRDAQIGELPHVSGVSDMRDDRNPLFLRFVDDRRDDFGREALVAHPDLDEVDLHGFVRLHALPAPRRVSSASGSARRDMGPLRLNPCPAL